jgi:hypothetical protein
LTPTPYPAYITSHHFSCVSAGIVDFSPHLDVLFTHFMGSFDVPVGAATSTKATLRSAPMKALMHHSYNVRGKRGRFCNSARNWYKPLSRKEKKVHKQ